MTLIDYFSDGIDVPRGFAIDPTGTWLFVCNERGDSIVQLAIDPARGTLTPTGHVIATPTPVHILFIP